MKTHVAAIVIAGAVFVLLTNTASAGSARVVDGDTIEIDEVTYRLHGIDAPEAGQSCNTSSGKTWPCGRAAIAQIEKLVRGFDVTCDNRGTDGYGRTIGVCIVDNVDINARLVADGFAWSFRKHSTDYAALEDAAHEKHLGIWQAETETPWDFRSHKWDVAKQEAPEGCPIKGNISANGQVYHTPWSPWYTRTNVNTEKGERWFCDEKQALLAGWRAPYWGQ